MSKLSWRVFATTDIGKHRPENQDNYFVNEKNGTYLVADGMGGTKGGAVASRLAVQTVEALHSEKPLNMNSAEMEAWLKSAACRANLEILNEAAKDAKYSNMGTTFLLAVQLDDKVHIANIGDSRAYLVRDGRIDLLTVDDSVVMEMYMRGQLTKQQVWDSPFRHLLTKCLGHDADLQVGCDPFEVRAGDWMILCSDGLSSVVTEEEILAIMNTCGSPEEACRKLVDETSVKGAPDNITIVVIQYFEEGEPEAHDA